jgi:hypothetical protein
MQYKAIAAVLGAASLIAMGIVAAEMSTNSSYSIDGAGAAVTEGPDPTTMATESFAPPVKATPPAGSRVRADRYPVSTAWLHEPAAHFESQT